MDDLDPLRWLSADTAIRLRARRPEPKATQQAAARAAALGDPTRLELAFLVMAGHSLAPPEEFVCVQDLATISGREQSLVSHHLQKLRWAEILDSKVERQFRAYEMTKKGEAILRAVLGSKPPVQ